MARRPNDAVQKVTQEQDMTPLAVVWPQALLMLVGAIVGGYAGAAVGRRLDPRIVRRVVILTGCAMTLYFFARS
jgi:uncharacterized protein